MHPKGYINKQGKVYWIDATNTVSMAQDIFPDIADKNVLVLDPLNPSYEMSSKVDPQIA